MSKPRFSLIKGDRGKNQGEWLAAANPKTPAPWRVRSTGSPAWEWVGGGESQEELRCGEKGNSLSLTDGEASATVRSRAFV